VPAPETPEVPDEPLTPEVPLTPDEPELPLTPDEPDIPEVPEPNMLKLIEHNKPGDSDPFDVKIVLTSNTNSLDPPPTEVIS